jgi:hypothetical protein
VNTPTIIPADAKYCALCLRESPLRLSHIIPEFAYKPAYDEKHRAHAIPGHAPDDNFYVQKGFRYPLLCDECEGASSTTITKCRFAVFG